MGRRWTVLTQTGALRATWAIGMGLLATLIAMALSVGYTARAQRHGDAQVCSLLRTLDRSPGVLTPDQRAEVHAQRHRLGC